MPQPVTGAACAADSLPVWMTHNTNDGTVDVAMGKTARDQWLEHDGCDPGLTMPVSPSPCVQYSSCSSGLPVVWCEPATGDHAPPSYAGDGIWGFFQSL